MEEEKSDSDGLPILTDRKDLLKEELTRRADQANEFLLTAARLIAPVMHEKGDWVAGYKWVIEQLRTDHEAVSNKVHGVHLKTHTPPVLPIVRS